MEILEIIKNKIISEDNNFYLSTKRKQEKWKVKDRITRKLCFESGKIIVQIRRYYKENDSKKEYFNVINSLFKDNKNKNIDLELKNKLIKLCLGGLSYRIIAKNYNIAHSSVYNIIQKNYNNTLNQMKFKNFQNLSKDKKFIYISVDDTYFNVKKIKNHIIKLKCRMINLFLLNKNKKPIAKNHLLIFSKPNDNIKTEELATKILNIINCFYSKELKIVVTGDGAKWIRSLAKKLKAKYVLCKFHLFSKLKVIFNNSYEVKIQLKQLASIIKVDLQQYIYECIKNHKYEEIYKFISKNWNEIYQCLNHNRALLLHNFGNYIKLNIFGLEDQENGWYYGNIAEAYVSHLIKSQIKKHYSIWNIRTIIQKILNPHSHIQKNIKVELFNIK
ncbi:hypothetical protein DMC14_002600 [Metamycoplasma phocicerebrale]|uniref:Transposase n=1 Tax=Metamycoplasma phocicerebrale TaxID=142649 RepID=A0A3T0TUE5_9BACT|nr:UPF0236 family protein [Metamycoplasma phocicerebrale]AZZ65660.1 hypothetical protein DMC14_002600 [Metamycoplasma phocicerebrale]